MAHSSLRVSLCQLSSVHDKIANFQTCSRLILESKKEKANMVFLPECFDYMSRNKEELIELAETLDGPLIAQYKNLAKENTIWLSLGGFHQKISNEKDALKKVYNTHIIINDKGEIVSTYNKYHLFDLDIPGKIRLKESDTTASGKGFVKPIETPLGNIGLLVGGAHILTYPSAFTIPTGSKHWELLNRARAVENQCYVISAAQVGIHNDKRSSYGHSMIVDPSGNVLLDMGGPDQAVNQCKVIELATSKEELMGLIEKIRREMPLENSLAVENKNFFFDHDVYRKLIQCSNLDHDETEEEDHYESLLPIDESIKYPFGPEVTIHPSLVIARNLHAFAFPNRSPLLPGHVLITTIRIHNPPESLMLDCSRSEVAALFDLAKIVARKALAPTYFNNNPNSAPSKKPILSPAQQIGSHTTTPHANLQLIDSSGPAFTVTVQDGKAAGATVPQVHVHLIPRHKGDLKKKDDSNADVDDNEIYRRLAERDAQSIKPETGNWRTVDDMAREADIYRKILYKNGSDKNYFCS
ncbi:unnamed protein product [Gordionus sp. m RMFG-2023]